MNKPPSYPAPLSPGQKERRGSEGEISALSSGSNHVRQSSAGSLSSVSTPKGGRKTINFTSDLVETPRRRKAMLAPEIQSFHSTNSNTTSITYAAQNDLKRLPIPTLEETLQRFPDSVRALQSETEANETLKLCKAFAEEGGKELQDALLAYEKEGFESKRIGSYIEEFWNESYLSYDDSVVLNLNPFFVLEGGPDPKIAKDQLRRAASLTFAALKFAYHLQSETLHPDVFKGSNLCMDQFKVIFGASRQPKAREDSNTCDDINVYRDSTHVVVLSNNQFYYFDALWEGDFHLAVDETDIFDILKAIKDHSKLTSKEESSAEAIGVFTALPRSQWAAARNKLTEVEINANALEVIDSALFVLVLDDYAPPNASAAAANMLHGTCNLSGEGLFHQVGTCLNRWYDKLQLIVCEDGTAGVNFEHSAIDGHTALRFVSDVFAETVINFAESITKVVHGGGRVPHVLEAPVERTATKLDVEGNPLIDVFPKKLMFDLSPADRKRIFYAETSMSDQIRGCDTHFLEFPDFGKQLLVGNKLSPDSSIQMAMFLAYYRLYGEVVCTYEPVLTKAFYHGRTEAMRTATVQAKRFCEVWCSPGATVSAKMDALRVATKEHSRLVALASQGKGVDRHLYALKCIGQRKGRKLPRLFDSDAWRKLNHTILSTSNCGNPALFGFGFGPVVHDGFGVGYIIKDSSLNFSVASKHRQTERYCVSLKHTLEEFQSMLKPLSSIQVSRQSLREINISKSHTYDDIFGESEAHEPKHSKGHVFAIVKERRSSFRELKIPEVRISMS